MKITLYQQDIVWLDPEANYRKIEAVLASHPDCELLVLPEMFSTGFVYVPKPGDLEKVADVESRLKDIAHRYDCALVGSVAVEEVDGSFHNRCYFVQPDGSVAQYDKRHLYSYGREDQHYVKGQERVIVNYKGIRFLLLVCYDLRFPVWSRCKDDYDCIICVANWPAVRQHSWEVLLQARAAENQAYVVGVNRVGDDLVCAYHGGSMVVHPYGDIIVDCRRQAEMCISAEPDMVMLQEFRAKFPQLRDADAFDLQ